MVTYSFTTSFQIKASTLSVWEVLLNFPDWKNWWPGVQKMAVSNKTIPPTLHVSIGFPFYKLALILNITNIDIGKRIQFTTKGELIGDGEFLVSEAHNMTKVTFNWNVATPKLWMNIVGTIAKPVFEFSHNLVMHWFVRGMAKKLHTKVTHARYIVNDIPTRRITIQPIPVEE